MTNNSLILIILPLFISVSQNSIKTQEDNSSIKKSYHKEECENYFMKVVQTSKGPEPVTVKYWNSWYYSPENMTVFNFPINQPLVNYKRISFSNNNDMHTFGTWGDTRYTEQKHINDTLISYDPLFAHEGKVEVNDMENGKLNALYWMNKKEYFMSAVIILKSAINFSWYFNAEYKSWYMGVIIYHYGQTWGSLSGGAIETSLGKEIYLYK